MNIIMRLIHAVPLYVYMVIENSRYDGMKLVTSLTHWWRNKVYTITDFKKYLLWEDIKTLSGEYGFKRRYNHTKHSLGHLESVMFEVEEDLRRYRNAQANGYL